MSRNSVLGIQSPIHLHSLWISQYILLPFPPVTKKEDSIPPMVSNRSRSSDSLSPRKPQGVVKG